MDHEKMLKAISILKELGKEPSLSTLIEAIQNNNVNIVALCIQAGIGVSEKTDGFYPLDFACEIGNLEITKLLIDSGGDVNKKNDHNMSAIYYAYRSGNEDIKSFLIEKGATDIEEKQKEQLKEPKNQGTFSLHTRKAVCLLIYIVLMIISLALPYRTMGFGGNNSISDVTMLQFMQGDSGFVLFIIAQIIVIGSYLFNKRIPIMIINGIWFFFILMGLFSFLPSENLLNAGINRPEFVHVGSGLWLHWIVTGLSVFFLPVFCLRQKNN